MLHVTKMEDHLKILTDKEVTDFDEYFKSAKEKLCSKLCEGQNIVNVAELLYIFLTTHDEVEKYAEII